MTVQLDSMLFMNYSNLQDHILSQICSWYLILTADPFSTGIVEFQDVSLKYDEDAKLILKNISFKTAGNEKIGIVGRTGAGKSSLITALFRLSEPTGKIMIDNIDVSKMGLHDLRKNISIIPQGINIVMTTNLGFWTEIHLGSIIQNNSYF